jgi:hypothetical protein
MLILDMKITQKDHLWKESCSSLKELLKYIEPKTTKYTLWDVAFDWHIKLCKEPLLNVTKKNYLLAFVQLVKDGVLNLKYPLKNMNEIWLNETLETIDLFHKWAKETRRHRKMIVRKLYAYSEEFKDKTNITRNRKRPPIPSIDNLEFIFNINTDFNKVMTIPTNKWATFFEALHTRNERDCLIYFLLLETALNVEYVLSLRQEDVFEDHIKLLNKVFYIPKCLTALLRELPPNKEGFIFVSSSGNIIKRSQIVRTLREASKEIGLEVSITPTIVINTAKQLLYCRENENDVFFSEKA